METIPLKTWRDLKKEVIDPYNSVVPENRHLFWFRGQGDASFPLQPTLDRGTTFSSDQERNEFASRLLAGFAKEMIGLTMARKLRADPMALLARHHGLPSPLLDWTESPYIAAYFAFQGMLEAVPKHRVAIFSLNRRRIPTPTRLSFFRTRNW